MCTVAYTGEKLAKFVDQYKHCHQVKINREKRLAGYSVCLCPMKKNARLIWAYQNGCCTIP